MIRCVPVVDIKSDLPWNRSSWSNTDSSKMLLSHITGSRRMRADLIIGPDRFRHNISARLSEDSVTRFQNKTEKIIGTHRKINRWTACPSVTESRFSILFFQYLNEMKSDKVEILIDYVSQFALHGLKVSWDPKFSYLFYNWNMVHDGITKNGLRLRLLFKDCKNLAQLNMWWKTFL